MKSDQWFDPNQAKCDNWCDHPVADRSLAIAQWSKTDTVVLYVMMVETDYVSQAPPASILTTAEAVSSV